MREYRVAYKPRRKALERASGKRENKLSGVGIRYTDDPKAYMKAYYAKNREKQLAEGKVRGAKWRAENRQYKIDRSRQVRAERKIKAFAILGGVCVKCGYEDHRALQVDHINGCGVSHKERNRTQTESGEKLYRRIVLGLVDLTKYQLLCANCNWIKRVENDECRWRQ
jgi:hypothetical protein